MGALLHRGRRRRERVQTLAGRPTHTKCRDGRKEKEGNANKIMSADDDAASSALAALAATPCRDLARAAGVSRPVRALAARLASAGLAGAADAGSAAAGGDDADVAALHAVFDAALAGGLGCYVLDYVVEVCGDPLMTSR